jgi:hypothetical protein
MEQLTPEERSTILRYLARPPRGRFDYFFAFAVYLIPSFLFALYGVWRSDFVAVAVAYLVLLIAIVYIIGYQTRSSRPFYSAIKKLVEHASGASEPPPAPEAAAGGGHSV